VRSTSSPEGDSWGHETAEGCFFFWFEARLFVSWCSVLKVASRAEYVSMDMSRPDTAAILLATRRVLGGNVCSFGRVSLVSGCFSSASTNTDHRRRTKSLAPGGTRDCQGATSGTRGALLVPRLLTQTAKVLRSFFPQVPAPSVLAFLSFCLYLGPFLSRILLLLYHPLICTMYQSLSE
jgi:hypothetical protein